LVAADQRIAAARWIQGNSRYFARLIANEVPVYRKADRSSEVIAVLPADKMEVRVDFRVTGLDGHETFWHVAELEEGKYIQGYIADDAVIP
jgi:hypothetical protein